MENNRFNRFINLIGNDKFKKLGNKKVLVVGIGGVGGMAAYSLVRSGITNIDLIDHDRVDITNINRQVVATTSSIGKKKVEVLKEILLDINPNLNINIYDCFYDENCNIELGKYDYVVDAIDSVKSKIYLITECVKKNIKIISSMGAGNRLDPTKVEIVDISKTENDPLAKIVRKKLRENNINHLLVAFSKETPNKVTNDSTPASSSFVPNSFGLVIASRIIRDFLEE